MKRVIVVALTLVMIMALGIGTASAANSMKKGAMGINVGMGDSVFGVKAYPGEGAMFRDVVNITGKFFALSDLAILAGFGFESDGGDADASYMSLMVGARKYMKVDDFAPFIEGKLTYASVTVDPDVVDDTIFDFSIGFGAEYFLGRQFSLEGSVGIGFGQISNDIDNFDDSYFGTRTVGVSANFYF